MKPSSAVLAARLDRMSAALHRASEAPATMELRAAMASAAGALMRAARAAPDGKVAQEVLEAMEGGEAAGRAGP